jgi:hypothetical protein
MESKLIKEIGITFILAEALTASGCGTIYLGMRYDDKGLGLSISRELNEKDKTRYVIDDISNSKYNLNIRR